LKRLNLLYWIVTVAAWPQALELHGRVEPHPRKGWVSLHSVETPFSTGQAVGLDGKFRFRDLKPGAYTVAVTSEVGEARQTVEVNPSAADKQGRVSIDLKLEVARQSRRHRTSAKELAIPPDAWRAYLEAQNRLKRHDIEGGMRQLERAVEIYPAFTAARNNLGTIAYQTGKYPLAEQHFRAALEHEAGAYEPTVNLGGVLLNLKRYEEALQYNRFAVTARPEDALAQSQLGMNLYFLRDADQAIRYLKEAKRLDPAHFSRPQLLLAEIYAQRGLREQAVAEVEDYLERHPEDPERDRLRALIRKLRQP